MPVLSVALKCHSALRNTPIHTNIGVIQLDVVLSRVQSRTDIIISKNERGEIKYLHLTAKEKDNLNLLKLS